MSNFVNIAGQGVVVGAVLCFIVILIGYVVFSVFKFFK